MPARRRLELRRACNQQRTLYAALLASTIVQSVLRRDGLHTCTCPDDFLRMLLAALIMCLTVHSDASAWRDTKIVYSKNFSSTPALEKRITAINMWRDMSVSMTDICRMSIDEKTNRPKYKQRDVTQWIDWFKAKKPLDKFSHKDEPSRRGTGRRVAENVYTAIKTLITDPAFETSGYRTLTWCVNKYIIENEDFFISPSTLRNYLKDFGCRMVLEYRVWRCFSQDNMESVSCGAKTSRRTSHPARSTLTRLSSWTRRSSLLMAPV